jgi:hypothetical protein
VAKDQLQEVYDFFRNNTSVPAGAELVSVAFPTTRLVGNEYEVERPARLLFQAKGQSAGKIRKWSDEHPRYFIDCDVICRGTPGDGPALDRFRVVQFRVNRAVLAPEPKGPGGVPQMPPR